MPPNFANPADLHNPVPYGYSHTSSVTAGTDLVFVAGQYGSDPHGAVASPVFAEQVQRAFKNIHTALAEHGLGLRDVVQLRTYVVEHDFEKLGAITRVITEHWGQTPPVQTMLGVASLATPEVLFEVEAIAARVGDGQQGDRQ